MENLAVRVRVPATSANLGPGFDTLGMALQLYSYVTVEVSPDEQNHIVMTGIGDVYRAIPDEKNIAWQAISQLAQRVQITLPPLQLTLQNTIPLARGLGSSAAARVGALVAVNIWLARQGKSHLDQSQLLELATELEGHPDNVAPALLGGMVTSASDGGKVLSSAITVSCWPHFLIFVPDTELSTNAARDILPKNVPQKDAIFNLSRLSMLVAVLSSGAWRENHALLHTALQDRLHQTYRAALMPAYGPVEEAALKAGALGVTLSGAGPSILIWLPCDATLELVNSLDNIVQQTANAHGVTGKIMRLKVDLQGCLEEKG